MSDSSSNRMKTCLDCGELKALEDFPAAKKRRDGRGSYCRPCMNVRSLRSRYQARNAAGRPIEPRRAVPPGQRWCPDCNAFKDLIEFPRHRGDREGRGRYCKPCHNTRGRDSRIKNHGSTREYHLRRRYGIGQVDVDRMLADQQNGCAVCGKPDPEHVDHDHATGAVRGMLCFNCNQALGNARDSIEVLEGLRRYLIVRRPHVVRRLGSDATPPPNLVIELAADFAGCGAAR